MSSPRGGPGTALVRTRNGLILVATVISLSCHFALRLAGATGTVAGIAWRDLPLVAALLIGGLPLIAVLLRHAARLEFSADLLAGIAIVTAVVLHEYLAGTIVVIMLSGGQLLEAYAVQSASSALQALAKRLPARAHRREGPVPVDVPIDAIKVGDELVILPHETCPVDGVVIDGRSTMDESYLTGEPYVLSKAAGSAVLSGAVNGDGVLTIRAERAAIDSRYAKIMQVMEAAEQRRPRLRRLGDQLGAVYNPVALGLAAATWIVTGDATRFLSVLVVATPCPLILAIPVAIVGSVSLAARRGIIIKDPAALERVGTCRTAIFDKTGTLTYGVARLIDVAAVPPFTPDEVLGAVASLEAYSRHPLATSVIEGARKAGLTLEVAQSVTERPGEGLRGCIGAREIRVTSRVQLASDSPDAAAALAPSTGGLECVVSIDAHAAGVLRFRDEPRSEGSPFVGHLGTRHGLERVLLVSGDRESEVREMAARLGIHEVHASQSPEQKLALVRQETAAAPTLFVGDGINDAPALTAATVGVGFGQGSDVTAEAASVVVMDSSLERVDELLHIGRRMRVVALQSAVAGMVLSVGGMMFAAAGYLPPVAGAVVQEVIDVLAVLNALRAASAPRVLSDY